MNHIHRLIWSQVTNTWVAISEISGGRGKGASRKLVAAVLSLGVSAVSAGPLGGQVTSGAGSIAQSGATTTIQQASQNLSLNWNSFNISKQETVNFVQPSASAIAVNRIFDTNGSQILGQLSANGQVYLINPNGIVFGQGAQVNVGSIVASTLDIKDASLTGAARTFAGNGSGSIVNNGTINAANGGYVALLGNTVSNQGTINAPQGTVALGAGSTATLTFQNNSLVSMQIDQSLLNSLVENGGLIKADGGQVVMAAGAKDSLLASVVNNTGVIQARTVGTHEGMITLLGGMAAGTVHVGGTLDASAPNGGNGGFIETSGAHVKIANDFIVTTAAFAATGRYGSWLIDPHNYTVASSGGDITGAMLSSNLATTNVELKSSAGSRIGLGDVNVNDAITWSANTSLTLTATNNININANINASGNTAGLVLNPNTANASPYTETAVNRGGKFNLGAGASINLMGTNTNLSIAGEQYIVINALGAQNSTTGTDLQGMMGSAIKLGQKYALGSNIDASSTVNWNGGSGFMPIGSDGARFTGTFDGLGHTIIGLTVVRPASIDNVGMFGFTGTDSNIQNIGLVGGSMSGGNNTGALVGNNASGSISNSYASSRVKGGAGSGGLIGNNGSGTLTNDFATGYVTGGAGTGGMLGSNISGDVLDSYATGNVKGAAGTGGLVGSSTSGAIKNSYATGNVDGKIGGAGAGAGGLVGSITSGAISFTHATGEVSGDGGTGGLVGSTTSGTIRNSYATGNVSGTGAGTGGLVGSNTSGSIDVAYATGNVTAVGAGTGGLVGSNTAGPIRNTYARGNVSSDGAGTGGLVGSTSGTVDNSYSTGTVASDGAGIGGLVGSSTAVIRNSFWDVETSGRLASIGGGKGMSTADMKKLANFTTTNTANNPQTPAWDFSSDAPIWDIVENVTYPLIKSLMAYSTVKVNDVTRAYAGQNVAGYANAYSYTASSPVAGTVSYTGSASTAVNAGTYDISASGLSSINQQYIVRYVNGNLTITPVAVTLSSVTATDRNYNAKVDVAVSATTVSGLVNNETLGLIGQMTNPNAGTLKGVTVVALNGAGANPGLASNYTVIQPAAGVTVNIGKAVLGLSGAVTATDRNYNALKDVAVSAQTITGLVGNETIGLSGLMADANAGQQKGVTVVSVDGTGSNAGLASNYTVNPPSAGVTVNIGKVALDVSSLNGGAITGIDRNYNAKVDVAVSATTVSGLVNNETVGIGGQMTNPNVGTLKGVTVVTLNGTGANAGLASNYTVSQPAAGVTVNIGKAVLALGGTVSATDRNYNALKDVAVSAQTITGLMGGETINLTGLMADANAGQQKGVTVVSVDGSGPNAGLASNYTVSQPAAAAAVKVNIAKLNVSVTGTPSGSPITATDRTYNALNTVAVNAQAVTGLLGSEALNYGGLMANANVGQQKAVTVVGLDGTGANAGLAINYNVIQPAGVTVNIGKALLSVTGPNGGAVSATDRNYNALKDVAVSAITVTGLMGGETLSFSGQMANANAGTNKTVTLTSADGTGANAGLASNYTVIQPAAGVTVNIGKAVLALGGTVSATDRNYNALKDVAVSAQTITGLMGGETINLTGLMADANAGQQKGVTVVSVDGNGPNAGLASNYTVSQPTAAAAVKVNIAKLNVVVAGPNGGAVSATDRTYNAQSDVVVNATTTSGLIGNETLNFGGLMLDANVGQQKAVTVVGLDGTGANAGLALNYNVTQPTAAVKVNITPALLSVTGPNGGAVSATDRNYNALKDVAVSAITVTGLMGGETLSFSGQMANANAGTNKTVTLTSADGTGANAGLASNYTAIQPAAGVTVNIGKAVLALGGTVSAADRNYNALKDVAVSAQTITGLMGGETINLTGLMADANAGQQKGVTVVSVDGNGPNAGLASNYTVSQPAAAAAVKVNIAKLNVSVTGTPSGSPITATDRTYNALNTVAVNAQAVTGLLGSEALNYGGLMANANVGQQKAVTVVGLDGTGANAGLAINYNVIQPTADIKVNINEAPKNDNAQPLDFQNVITQLKSNFLPTRENTPQLASSLSSSMTVTYTSSAAPLATSSFQTPANVLSLANTELKSTGLSLQIVDGGVLLPSNIINIKN